MTEDPDHPRTVRLEISIDRPGDLRLLRGALLAAKATELAEAHRRGARLSFGYGSDAAREAMNSEITQSRRRVELLGRLLEGLDGADRTPEA